MKQKNRNMGNIKNKWTIAGLMSGTSLDGLDIALCEFRWNKNRWHYSIRSADTIPYPASMKKKLGALMKANAEVFAREDAAFGKYSGEQVKTFLRKHSMKADFIASHGHTVFHQPSKGFTTQIGNGAFISAASGLPVVSDFRTMDVALGGQGAPLVPVGDKLLFGEYEYCLNLGGIANISLDDKKGKRIAYDICPVNIVLNKLAEELGKKFDRNGNIAAGGKVHDGLLRKLNTLSYYKESYPKSLGREWIDKVVLPVVESASCSIQDKLTTFCEHIAVQISMSLENRKGKTKLLATGGGAMNSYLIKRISFHAGKKTSVIIPDASIISYKEALIFAFLGLKRIINEANALSSVTGASEDSIGGALYGRMPDL